MTDSPFLTDLKDCLSKKDITTFRRLFNRLADCNEYIIDNEKDEVQMNILHFLSSLEEESFAVRCIEMILSHHDIDINKTGMIDGNYGLTAAHMAIMNKNVNILKLLVDKDCDLFRCESYGKNVQDYALQEMGSTPELYDIVKTGLYKWYDRQNHPDKSDSGPSSSRSIDKIHTMMSRARLLSESSMTDDSSVASIPTQTVRDFWNRKAEAMKNEKNATLTPRSFSMLASPKSDVFFTPPVSKHNSSMLSSSPSSSSVFPPPPPPPFPSNGHSFKNTISTPKRASNLTVGGTKSFIFSKSAPPKNSFATKISTPNLRTNFGPSLNPSSASSSGLKLHNTKLNTNKWTSSQSYFSSPDSNHAYSTPIAISSTPKEDDCQVPNGFVQKLRRQLFNE